MKTSFKEVDLIFYMNDIDNMLTIGDFACTVENLSNIQKIAIQNLLEHGDIKIRKENTSPGIIIYTKVKNNLEKKVRKRIYNIRSLS